MQEYEFVFPRPVNNLIKINETAFHFSYLVIYTSQIYLIFSLKYFLDFSLK